MRPTGPASFLLAAILAAAFAGCADSSEPSTLPADTSDGPIDPTDDANEPPIDDPNVMGTSHHHNYWGHPPRASIVVFEGSVTLKAFPLDGMTQETCNAIGYAEFDLEADGDHDVASGRSDVIMPGTNRITATITWTDSAAAAIEGLAFRYKPANDWFYHDDTTPPLQKTTCGVAVPNGQPFTIPVAPLQFDPAHQTNLSRWRFQIWASGDLLGLADNGLPIEPPHVKTGDVQVAMSIHYGGETYLDPPHPNLFGKNSSLALGRTRGYANFTLIADPMAPDEEDGTTVVRSPFNFTRGNGREMTGLTFPWGRITPLDMTRLEIVACIEYRSDFTKVPPNSRTIYRLAYHGADTSEYALFSPIDARDGCDVYEVRDPNGVKVDSPYENESQWGFRIVPVTDGHPYLGYFEGVYDLSFTAFR